MKKTLIIPIVVVLGIGIIGYFIYSYTNQTTYKTAFSETVTLEGSSTPVNDFDQLISLSSTIVRGTVTDSGTYRLKSFSNGALENKEGVYTDYPVKGVNLKSSDNSESVFIIATDGGVKNDKKYQIADAPIIAKDQEYVVFAVTNDDGLLRPLASGHAIAKKVNDTTYELPASTKLSANQRTFTIDTLTKAIKKP